MNVKVVILQGFVDSLQHASVKRQLCLVVN